jgi:peptidoglycan/xylan/chitin deacetylase (PgdA/CDA1 family)
LFSAHIAIGLSDTVSSFFDRARHRAPDVAASPPPRSEAVERAYRRLVEIAAQDEAERQRGIKLLKVITGDPSKPYIALTFDDGPHGPKTHTLLDVLRKLVCPATFFVVGMQAKKFPEVIQRMILEGHELGNHTYHHYRLPKIPLEEIPYELNATRDVLNEITGLRTRLFRPPGGEYNAAIQHVVEANGYATILWSDDPADYVTGRTPAQIEGFVMRDITPGGIILLHDGIPATWTVLPRLVARMRAKGYIFVTVSELIQRGGGLLRVREIKASRTSASP